MNNDDILQRFIFEKSSIRGELVRLGLSFTEIVTQHDYPGFIKKILGELLVVGTLLSAIIKFKGKLTVQFQGKGKLKLLIAEATNEHTIRGLAQWDKSLTESELSEAFQQGVLVIIMQGKKVTQHYQGIVAWQGNNLAQSIEGYFRDSEQLLTRVWLAVNDTKAAGMLLQVLPGKNEHMPADWDTIVHLSDTVKPEELLELDNETLLRRLYTIEAEVRLFPATPVRFRCTCSQTRSENALLLLGQEEAKAELKNKNEIVVTCDFCSKKYVFDRIDVEKLFKQRGGPSSTQVH